MPKYLGLFTLAVVTGAACLAASNRPAPQSAPPAGPADPRYDEKGDLRRPDGFRTWVFVGANLGLRYHPDLKGAKPREQDAPKKDGPGEFHNVYIQPEAYDHYRKTGQFPEPTVLVMEVFEAKERDGKGIVSAGHFPGARRRVEAAVKNSKRPDGSKTDWAYYDFGADKATASAFRDAACYDCHLRHADLDNVWVQFYPVLRPQGMPK